MRRHRPDHRSEAATRGRRRAGFTLMEMIVVLAIMVLMTTFFMVSFGETSEEQVLSPLAQDLKQLARTAVTEAAAYREDYAIVLTPEQLQLVRGQGAGAGGAVSLEIERSVAVPGGATVTARWPGEDEWRPVDGDAWLFRSGGLCEPILIRLGTTKSNAYIELAFDPLTGMAEEQSYFP
ncbi:MAG: prepilin-type N-terminal cleavage/methylation domain-containing protein [Verrucomicrobiae bacterium]|nr:prepilin-type N-terminal cleavage/methylation domain-containing protein [Verrucomicrobiae bacterium]